MEGGTGPWKQKGVIKGDARGCGQCIIPTYSENGQVEVWQDLIEKIDRHRFGKRGGMRLYEARGTVVGFGANFKWQE